MNTIQLAELEPGCSAIVTGVCGVSRFASRLMEMGFVPGAVVDVLRRAPFGGPVQYRVHGISVSMRSTEAGCVMVQKRSEECSSTSESRSRHERTTHFASENGTCTGSVQCPSGQLVVGS